MNTCRAIGRTVGARLLHGTAAIAPLQPPAIFNVIYGCDIDTDAVGTTDARGAYRDVKGQDFFKGSTVGRVADGIGRRALRSVQVKAG